ncbi:glycosyltransferase [Agromyces allii]|uniref:Glycosyltransferase n=1 Tax=Agromyces allii TaxID=393607 RepID=A0ABP5BGR9_9MICO|nr:glycosyltransferase [Agromyces allii]
MRWAPEPSASGTANPMNFGDLLGPLVMQRILAERVGRRDTGRARRVLSVGSVLHLSRPGDVVWGTGVNGKIDDQQFTPSLDVRAVRGPYTRAVLAARGIAAPAVYGDPALLIPHLFPEFAAASPSKRRSVLVVPNLHELDRFTHEGTLSPLTDPWTMVEEIAASEFVAASSLHALIIADALGIPSRPITAVAENPFKYLDHYAGTGRPDVRFASSIDEAIALGPVPAAVWDPHALLAAFPFDVWTGDASPGFPADAPTAYLELAADAAMQRAALRNEAGTDPGSETLEALERLDALSAQDAPVSGLTREELDYAGLARPIGDATTAPLLSVVIPAHNTRPWIGETLSSVLAQDLDGMEVIVVDDHSTDGTRAALEEIAATDSRLRVIDSVTRGGGTARNIGADHARGRYLVFCDGDDLVPEGAYRSLVASLEGSGSDIAFGDYVKFSPTSTWRPTANWPAYAAPSRGITIHDEPTLINGRPCWNKAFRRSFWEASDIRFPDVPRSNDIVPMVTAYLAAERLDVVENVVYLYRERPGASSMTAKAASAEAVKSYLTQELACARLIRDHASDELRDRYAMLFLARDGWVHLAKYFRSEDRTRAQDDEIAGLVGEIVEVLDLGPDAVREPNKRMLLQLIDGGWYGLATTIATLFSGAETDLAVRLHHWRRAVERPDGEPDPFEQEYFADALLHDLSRAVLESGVDGAAVLDLTRTLERRHPAPLTAIPELASRPLEPELLERRLARAREVNAALLSVETGSALTIRFAGSISAYALEPVLYDEATGAAHPMSASSQGDDENMQWTGTIAHSALPKHVFLRPALRDVATGEVLTTRFDAVTPEYDRFDRFLMTFDPRGIRLARRSNWLKRAAARVGRATSRRIRRPSDARSDAV